MDNMLKCIALNGIQYKTLTARFQGDMSDYNSSEYSKHLFNINTLEVWHNIISKDELENLLPNEFTSETSDQKDMEKYFYFVADINDCEESTIHMSEIIGSNWLSWDKRSEVKKVGKLATNLEVRHARAKQRYTIELLTIRFPFKLSGTISESVFYIFNENASVMTSSDQKLVRTYYY